MVVFFTTIRKISQDKWIQHYRIVKKKEKAPVHEPVVFPVYPAKISLVKWIKHDRISKKKERVPVCEHFLSFLLILIILDIEFNCFKTKLVY